MLSFFMQQVQSLFKWFAAWAPSRPPKAFNGSTGKFLTHSTGFNDSAWGDQTREFVKLINKRLRPKSYNNIVAGTQDFVKNM